MVFFHDFIVGQSDLSVQYMGSRPIFADAMKPAVEQNLVITLPDELIKALEKATKLLKVDADELATQVLSEWLKSQGFS